MNATPQVRSRILVIDDNQAIHDDFRKVLDPEAAPSPALRQAAAALFDRDVPPSTRPSYEIDTVLRGQDGVELVRKAMEEGRPYAMAYVDMRMPNGWNGLETTRRLWQIAPGLRVVLCTAFSDFSWNEIREELRHSDRFLILKKPFDNIEVEQLTLSLSVQAAMEAEAASRNGAG
jgi:CheY-like chemotaxis protein